jgi:hypothetical protein
MRRSVLLSLLVLFAACGEAVLQSIPDNANRIEAPAAVRAAFDSAMAALSSYTGVTDRRRQVIRDAETWESVWAEVVSPFAPTPALPAVDFDQYMIVFVAMGTRHTGGHSTEVEAVTDDSAALVARVREVSPGPGCITTQALTAPVAAKLVPRRDREVTWEEQVSTQDCSS